jgi:hypothetical protein
LDDDETTHLSKGTLANTSEEDKVEEVGISIKVDWLDDGEDDDEENEGSAHLRSTAYGAHNLS